MHRFRALLGYQGGGLRQPRAGRETEALGHLLWCVKAISLENKCPHMFTKTRQESHGSLVGDSRNQRWCRCVLVAAWEVIESKGKQDVAYKPLDSKMVGS